MKKDTIEIGVQVQPEDNATAKLMEGALHTDRYLHIGKDDVLVLRCSKMLFPEKREQWEKSIFERSGVKTVIIDAGLEVIGVVEHGGEVRE